MVFVLTGWVLFRAADFSTASSILSSLVGLNGFGGTLSEIKQLAIAALVSATFPSAHEIKDGSLIPHTALAAGAAVLAAYCVLDVGGRGEER